MSLGSEWFDYPMGPGLRHVLSLPLEQEEPTQAVDQKRHEAFREALRQELPKTYPLSKDEAVTLITELTQMDLCDLCLDLAAEHSDMDFSQEFMALLSLGAAAMREGETQDAVSYLERAHSLEPYELSVINNLVLIYEHLQNHDQLSQWLDIGLAKSPNEPLYWEAYARLLMEQKPIEEVAKQLQSRSAELEAYAGYTLAADLLSPGDGMLLAEFLEKAYQSGLRTSEFLVEYTGALGMSGDFEKVKTILWEAQTLGSLGSLPWRLTIHLAQAHAALEEFDKALSLLEGVMKDPDVPEKVLAEIEELKTSLLN